MKPLCVIPARAGSKRLPNKNTVDLCGRPLVAYTIAAARESGIFDHVFVSTESPEIAEVARTFGAEAPFLRPASLAGDEVTNVDVSLQWLDNLVASGHQYDAIVCLQPSSPLRLGNEIKRAWQIFVEEKRDFVVSVTAIDPHYFHWALENSKGIWIMFFGRRFKTIRQNLPTVFRPNGAIKIARPDSLRREGNFFGDNLGAFVMPEETSVHVATETDLAICEAFVNRRR